MKVLVTGHPRSGTRFASQCFKFAGWQVGHEELLSDGISSWLWAVNSNECPWGPARNGHPLPENRIHILRNPAKCIASVVAVERGSEEWRFLWIKYPDFCPSPIEIAVWSLYGWSRLVRENIKPTLTVKTENLPEYVENLTGVTPWDVPIEARNSRVHRAISEAEIEATPWVHWETAGFWDQIQSDYRGAL